MRYSVMLLSLVFATGIGRLAHASCGAANCPLNNYSYLRAGWIRLGFTHEYINQDRIYVGSSLSFVGAIPEDHDEVQTLNERNTLEAQIGLLDNLAMSLAVPFVHREHSHILHTPNGDEWESWTFDGLGDVTITGAFSIIRPAEESDPSIGLIAGVKMPTGVTDARNAGGKEAEVTIQPGSGSFDGLLGLHYRQTLAAVPMIGGFYGSLPLIAGVTVQIPGRGKDGYRFGNSLLASVGTSYQFARSASVLFQLNGRFQDYADVGITGEPRENTGGAWVYASPGIELDLGASFSGNVYLQLPLYQNVHGIQQTSKFNLSIGLGYFFSLTGSGETE